MLFSIASHIHHLTDHNPVVLWRLCINHSVWEPEWMSNTHWVCNARFPFIYKNTGAKSFNRSCIAAMELTMANKNCSVKAHWMETERRRNDRFYGNSSVEKWKINILWIFYRFLFNAVQSMFLWRWSIISRVKILFRNNPHKILVLRIHHYTMYVNNIPMRSTHSWKNPDNQNEKRTFFFQPA